MAVTATLALEVRPRRDPCTAGLDSDHTSDFQPDLDHTSNESILGSAPSHLYLVTADPSPDLRGAVERLCVDPVLATASPAAAEAAEA
nr:hypothetical protein [Chloroflexia bacterium]